MGNSASAIDPVGRPEDPSAQLGPAAAKPAPRKPSAKDAPKPSKVPPPAPAKPSAAPEPADTEPDDSKPGWLWSSIVGFFRGSASWLVSCLVHLVVLIILALWFLPSQEQQKAPLISAHVDGEVDMLEEFEDYEELDFDEMEDVSMVVEDPGAAAFGTRTYRLVP